MVDSFDQLAAAAFALDPGVRWVAVTRPGEQPRWRYRSNVQPLDDAASDEAEERLANPGILSLGRSSDATEVGDGLIAALAQNARHHHNQVAAEPVRYSVAAAGKG